MGGMFGVLFGQIIKLALIASAPVAGLHVVDGFSHWRGRASRKRPHGFQVLSPH